MYIFGILKKSDEAKIKIAQILLSAIFFSRTPKHFYHSITMLLHVLWQNKLVFQACKSNINGLVLVCVSYHLEIWSKIKITNETMNESWHLYVNLKVDWVENLRRLKEIMRRDDILEMACWDCSCWWYESRECTMFQIYSKTWKNL